MNRDNRENWEAEGSQDIVDLAYEKSLEVLNTYEPKPRPDNVQKELDRIYTEFEQEIAERKANKAVA
jgi:trimethylamine--corrinoid protein Co-methyltransferase